MLLEKIENFTKYVRLKVHQEPPLQWHATPQFGQNPLGNPKHLFGWNSSRMMPLPKPHQAARRWCKHQCTDPLAPGYEKMLDISHWVVAAVRFILVQIYPTEQNFYLFGEGTNRDNPKKLKKIFSNFLESKRRGSIENQPSRWACFYK